MPRGKRKGDKKAPSPKKAKKETKKKPQPPVESSSEEEKTQEQPSLDIMAELDNIPLNEDPFANFELGEAVPNNAPEIPNPPPQPEAQDPLP